MRKIPYDHKPLPWPSQCSQVSEDSEVQILGQAPDEGFHSSDGKLEQVGGKVRMHQEEGLLEKRILLLGCDPAFSILNAHVTRYGKGAELLCRFASSRRALAGLQTAHAHLASAHLHNTGVEKSHVEFAKTVLKNSKALVVGFFLAHNPSILVTPFRGLGTVRASGELQRLTG